MSVVRYFRSAENELMGDPSRPARRANVTTNPAAKDHAVSLDAS
jgi:hypothetical protein